VSGRKAGRRSSPDPRWSWRDAFVPFQAIDQPVNRSCRPRRASSPLIQDPHPGNGSAPPFSWHSWLDFDPHCLLIHWLSTLWMVVYVMNLSPVTQFGSYPLWPVSCQAVLCDCRSLVLILIIAARQFLLLSDTTTACPPRTYRTAKYYGFIFVRPNIMALAATVIALSVTSLGCCYCLFR